MALRDLGSIVDRILWRTDSEIPPRWKEIAAKPVRFAYVMIRDMGDGQLNLRAMSLVYTTLLSLVPLLAISFSVLKGFGVHNKIEPFLMNFLAPMGEPGVEVATRIIGFVDNIKVGVLGSVGLGLLVYTVVSLMQKIENAFNFVWHVPTDRSMGRRFTGYLSVLLIGPLLVFSSLGITASMTASPLVQTLITYQPFGWLLALGGKLLPYLLVVLAFAFMYLYLPNTRVRVGSAMVGALVSGVLWETLGWAFTNFVVASTSYTAIYSAFATLILFMMWLYLSWLVLLMGASVAFYHQHPECLMPVRERDIRLSPRLREKLALVAMTLIARHFYRGLEPWTPQGLAQALRMPMIAVDSTVDALEVKGFVRRTSDQPARLFPARPLEATTANDVLEAVRAAAEQSPYLSVGYVPANRAVDDLIGEVDAARAAAATRTIKELALADKPDEVRGNELPLRRASGD